ncbi:flavin reductase family protein [Ruegeria sp. EL01]|jgi:flavin reductase (DIM6/NTAB) family NADH-FMN oxidoreductase RutF|uniref:flavin reductase family protein n=1 Tax=Ruegeria sp. EL01 TaxID=2107578 RepID=UPI000EA8065C|nr:flavin reductase family protein [Ruegeria sp. EL01]
MNIRDYRNALGSFPTGVTIVTAFDADHQPWGLTANSFTSVSLQPPVISVCVAKSGRVFPTLSGSNHFAVNILSADQQALALHFASDVENRFTDTNWIKGNAAPILPGASAHLHCVTHDRVDAGDHEILLGRVTSYTHAPVPPLVYCRGNFFAASH